MGSSISFNMCSCNPYLISRAYNRRNNKYQLVDLEEERHVIDCVNETKDCPIATFFSNDGRTLIAEATPNKINVYNFEECHYVSSFMLLNITSICIGPENKLLVSTQSDGIKGSGRIITLRWDDEQNQLFVDRKSISTVTTFRHMCYPEKTSDEIIVGVCDDNSRFPTAIAVSIESGQEMWRFEEENPTYDFLVTGMCYDPITGVNICDGHDGRVLKLSPETGSVKRGKMNKPFLGITYNKFKSKIEYCTSVIQKQVSLIIMIVLIQRPFSCAAV